MTLQSRVAHILRCGKRTEATTHRRETPQQRRRKSPTHESPQRKIQFVCSPHQYDLPRRSVCNRRWALRLLRLAPIRERLRQRKYLPRLSKFRAAGKSSNVISLRVTALLLPLAKNLATPLQRGPPVCKNSRTFLGRRTRMQPLHIVYSRSLLGAAPSKGRAGDQRSAVGSQPTAPVPV